jgi:chromosomal replication initiation ATPase DnaA
MDPNIWDQILTRIETKVNRHSYYTWFRPTSFVADRGSSIAVRVPNALFKDWLTKHYSLVLAEALTEVQRPDVAVLFLAEGVDMAPSEDDVLPPPPPPAADPPTESPAAPAQVDSTAAIPSTPSSSDRRTSLPTRRAARWLKRRRGPITRCSSTAASGSGRRT